jgi:glycosyltransferase involved in cell wall biosynthesis
MIEASAMNRTLEHSAPYSTAQQEERDRCLRKSVSVIVPVHNDKASILPTKTKLEAALRSTKWEYELIFVDDGSTDGGKELLEQHRIYHIAHSRNRGYGAAIKTGVSTAKSDYICIIDCDLTYPPEEIPRLLEHTEQYPMVVGARKVIREPLLHNIGRRFVDCVLRRAFRWEVPDINSGLRVFEARAFREYMPALCDRFSLTASITFGFLLDGRPTKYVPIQYCDRNGTTKVRNLSYAWSFLRSYIRMYGLHLETNARR